VTPLADDNLLPNSAWVIQIPAKANAGMLRVLGAPKANFGYDWSRAFALEIETCTDTTGNYVNPIDIPETIQAVDLTLEITEDSYDITAP
jgi:hypothetical protein